MEKILVIRLGAIGDVILTSATLTNLKMSFPEAEIFLLTRRQVADLADLFAGVDKILPFPMKASPVDLFRMGEYLDSIGFDKLIDLHGNIRSYYLMRHISASVKVHYPKRRLERLKAVKLKKFNPNPPHTIDLYNTAVKMAGGKAYAIRPIINLPDSATTGFSKTNSKPAVAIAPGASYPAKQWPLQRFAELAVEIYKLHHCHIVLALTESDIEIRQLIKEIPTEYLFVFVDSDLVQLANVISQVDLLISNDSGLAHLGSSVGTPVVAIFGPTHPTLGFSPRGLWDVIIQVDEYCRPCSRHGKKACYRDQQYCFNRIKTDDVLSIASECLNSAINRSKALFIDRDGTLIKEKYFISRPENIEIEENSVEALQLAKQAGFKIIVLSNQSGVARGYFDERTVRLVNQHVQDIFRTYGIDIDDFFYCPHLSGAKVKKYDKECICRKPAPGMVENAALKHNINPFESFVIGDKLSDVNLAYVTGGKGVLVRTGYGRKEEEKLLNSLCFQPEKIADNLFDGIRHITGKRDC